MPPLPASCVEVESVGVPSLTRPIAGVPSMSLVSPLVTVLSVSRIEPNIACRSANSSKLAACSSVRGTASHLPSSRVAAAAPPNCS